MLVCEHLRAAIGLEFGKYEAVLELLLTKKCIPSRHSWSRLFYTTRASCLRATLEKHAQCWLLSLTMRNRVS